MVNAVKPTIVFAQTAEGRVIPVANNMSAFFASAEAAEYYDTAHQLPGTNGRVEWTNAFDNAAGKGRVLWTIYPGCKSPRKIVITRQMTYIQTSDNYILPVEPELTDRAWRTEDEAYSALYEEQKKELNADIDSMVERRHAIKQELRQLNEQIDRAIVARNDVADAMAAL